jgi:LysR family transcriptional regulator, nitrogen assimilation regulatory protein
MDLAKLEMFVRVAELGSLSRAALHYDLGPSALSRQLAALEAECHGRLLHRTGRGVRLTDLGERILPRARVLIAEAAALSAEIGEVAGICRGTVHVACLPVIAAPLITRVVLLARERYPEVIIHASDGLRGQIEQSLADGTVDLAFVIRISGDKSAERPLAVSPLCLVGPPGDRLTQRASMDFKALDGVPILLPTATEPFRISLGDVARQLGVNLNVVAEIDSVHLMKDMAAVGVGYALLSMLSISGELKSGRLSATPIVNPEIKRSIYLVASTRKVSSLAVREVSRLIRQVAEELASSGVWGDQPELP